MAEVRIPARDAAPVGYPDPRLPPWPGLTMAAAAAVQHLSERLGLDLWLVNHVDRERLVVVAAAGPWAALAAPGIAFSWRETFCARMVEQRGPTVAPDVLSLPEYAPLATGVLARVRGYLGVPLEGAEGQFFGTLCAFSGQPQPDLASGLSLVQLVGQLLSTIVAREQVAHQRSQDAAAAYALAERDRLTGLHNRRGWESGLAREDDRCRRYGSSASVLVLDLDDLKRTNDAAGHAAGDELLTRCAGVLTGTSRPGDALARLGGDEFGVLAVQCDAVALRALLTRLRVQLRAAGVAASAGAATRRAGEELAGTWRRADAAMYRDKQRRKRRGTGGP